MKSEEVFGVNAGKVWRALKENGPMSAGAIVKQTKMKLIEVYGGLGWLGREGKIEILKEKKGVKYKLLD